MSGTDEIEAAIFGLLRERGGGKSICPSEVARALAQDETAWRSLMPAVRKAGTRLQREGRLRVTQRGLEVDGAGARGAIRFSLPQHE